MFWCTISLLIIGFLARSRGLVGVADAITFIAAALFLWGAVRLLIDFVEKHLPPIEQPGGVANWTEQSASTMYKDGRDYIPGR